MAAYQLSVAVLACVLVLGIVGSVQAQNTPQDYLDVHNTARAAVGVGKMVWNNLFWESGKEWTAREAVQLWVDEKQFYNNTTNTCATGKVCGHYTQVVWRNSVNLGCARVKCNSGAIFITSNYSPRGNIFGQRPY
ncbi:unnamed protein product [Spirodela intermedia]|uniref:SCP domain-containing protein n=1 Tax=Spirodela intermedia TaxID=51605 RepID=A0A7I8K976_SPIIN|nr:unnamed protein product [Spirodela intermedia]